jgi:hypothetical protein
MMSIGTVSIDCTWGASPSALSAWWHPPSVVAAATSIAAASSLQWVMSCLIGVILRQNYEKKT